MKCPPIYFLFLACCFVLFSTPHILKASAKKTMRVHKNLFYQRIPSFEPIPFDSTLIAPFFSKYPKLNYLKPEVVQLYRKHNYHYLWFDYKGLNEFANILYDKINNLDQEGLKVRVPYEEKIRAIFQDPDDMEKSNIEVELLMSSLYFFYADRVFKGLNATKTAELDWYLPRKKQSYVNNLDSLLRDPKLINQQDKDLLGQYYLLKNALKKYRDIEKKGGWNPIILPKKIKSLKPKDTAEVILQIRKRLLASGDLDNDSGKNVFDSELLEAILKYKKRNAFAADSLLLPKHIANMNIPISEHIKTIMINMERCRWISPSLTRKKQYITVNIPAFTLTYFIDGKPELVSKVVVGKALNKTAVFSGELSQIVFSPYWNVPPSILQKEILPAIAKNPNYLAKNDMEWINNRVRQRPGPQNALGKVKFVFPNSHIIYMHDTPAKSLFNQDSRAFSHGCIRVERPRDLAILLLKEDPNWPVEKIDEAMNKGIEKTYNLKTKIPVYIGYFTAWVNRDGTINFYDDIYGHDERLAEILFTD